MNMITGKELAQQIKVLSAKNNIPVKRVLSDCNINRNYIYDLENKISFPPWEKVLKLAEYFGVSTDYLLGVTDRPNHAEPPAPEMTEQDKAFCSDYLNLSEQGKEYMRQTMDMVKEKYIKAPDLPGMETKIG